MNNLYQELELTSNCSFEDIKHQYRTLARMHHPDMGGDAEKFKKIKFAYEILSDPIKRDEYDKTGNVLSPDNIQNQARENLYNVFHSIMENYDPGSQDIIQLIKNDIEFSIVCINTNIEQCCNQIKKLEATQSKIFIKHTIFDNVFESFTASEIQNIKGNISSLEEKKIIAKEMLRILDNYTYGFVELANTNH